MRRLAFRLLAALMVVWVLRAVAASDPFWGPMFLAGIIAAASAFAMTLYYSVIVRRRDEDDLPEDDLLEDGLS